VTKTAIVLVLAFLLSAVSGSDLTPPPFPSQSPPWSFSWASSPVPSASDLSVAAPSEPPAQGADLAVSRPVVAISQAVNERQPVQVDVVSAPQRDWFDYASLVVVPLLILFISLRASKKAEERSGKRALEGETAARADALAAEQRSNERIEKFERERLAREARTQAIGVLERVMEHAQQLFHHCQSHLAIVEQLETGKVISEIPENGRIIQRQHNASSEEISALAMKGEHVNAERIKISVMLNVDRLLLAAAVGETRAQGLASAISMFIAVSNASLDEREITAAYEATNTQWRTFAASLGLGKSADG
jgi:hypothetical protein